MLGRIAAYIMRSKKINTSTLFTIPPLIMSKKRQRMMNREQLQADAAEPVSTKQARGEIHGSAASGKFIALNPQQASRLIYPNPVCFLTSISPASKLNAMTLSWLAPANNYGGFVFVIHKTRFSASCLLEKKEFMLSVAHANQIDLLLACGKVSGGSVDKLDGSIPGLSAALEATTAKSAGNAFSALQDSSDDDSDNEEGTKALAVADTSFLETAKLSPIAGAVASMKCTVVSHSEAADAGHWLVVAQISEAQVHPQYWDGKVFGPTDENLPGLVSFLGSQQFAVLTRHICSDQPEENIC